MKMSMVSEPTNHFFFMFVLVTVGGIKAHLWSSRISIMVFQRSDWIQERYFFFSFGIVQQPAFTKEIGAASWSSGYDGIFTDFFRIIGALEVGHLTWFVIIKLFGTGFKQIHPNLRIWGVCTQNLVQIKHHWVSEIRSMPDLILGNCMGPMSSISSSN